jgi:hypothetical protein
MSIADLLPPTTRRVELHTAPHLNLSIRKRADAEVLRLEGAAPGRLEQRLEALDREWDVERLLQTNASVLVLLGVGLGSQTALRCMPKSSSTRAPVIIDAAGGQPVDGLGHLVGVAQALQRRHR